MNGLSAMVGFPRHSNLEQSPYFLTLTNQNSKLVVQSFDNLKANKLSEIKLPLNTSQIDGLAVTATGTITGISKTDD